MTVPTPDAQSSNSAPPRKQFVPSLHSTHSIANADTPAIPQSFSPFPSSAAPSSTIDSSKNDTHEHAIDFATHSWDLATGGLKTLTAKRTLPTTLERRPMGNILDNKAETRNYTVIMAILVCLILMLIGGGVVLFVMMQP